MFFLQKLGFSKVPKIIFAMFGYRKVSSGKEKNIKENNFLILGFAIKNIKLKLVKKLSIKKKKNHFQKTAEEKIFTTQN